MARARPEEENGRAEDRSEPAPDECSDHEAASVHRCPPPPNPSRRYSSASSARFTFASSACWASVSDG